MIEDYRSAQRAGQRAYSGQCRPGDSRPISRCWTTSSPMWTSWRRSLWGWWTSRPRASWVPRPPDATPPLPPISCLFSTTTPSLQSSGRTSVTPIWKRASSTPIIAFEYLNKFYVQEGNKRVSVLKYYEAVKIPGTVTRLIPAKNDTLENKLYYEFLDFYKFSRINYVQLLPAGGLCQSCRRWPVRPRARAWTDDDRLNFSSLYTMFSQQFYALGGGSLGLTPGDALLVYLSVYRYADACESTPTKVRENLARLWDEVKILAEPHAVELLLEPKQSSEPLLSKLNIFSSRPSELRVVFLHEHNAQTSAWVRGQDKGRAALVKAFPDKLYVSCRENVNPEVDAEQVLEEVAHDHADIVFTTSARMHTACLKVAAQHPKTRFLNCSLNAPHPLVRTYYPRTYEVTYLLGMLAGIVSHSDKVGYVAANPVYGVPAAINAFAQGVRAVRPDSRVVLRWACLCDAAHPQDFSDRKDIEVFYSQDFREPEGTYRDYGLCRRLPDGVLQPLGLPEWRWDVFFTEIVRSVFAGTWDSAPGGRAINYWWGLKSGAERVEYPTRLNDGTMQLLKMAERQLCDGEIQVFPTESYSQGHALHHAASGIYTPKELMEMDWLEECVEGELPSYDELDAKTRSLLNINGLDNVKGTPQ